MKWKDQSVQSYTDQFYWAMARLSTQEEEKLLVLKYVSSLSPYIQQEMEFLTVSILADAFHYANKLEEKQKGNARFTNKPTGWTFDKKSSVDPEKSKHSSQPTLPKHDYHKNKF